LDPDEWKWRRVWPLIDPIEGFLLEHQARWLFKAALSVPDGSNLVEIGSFKGRSASSLAFGCRRTKKRVFAIDSFDGNEWDFYERGFFKEFSNNVALCGLSEYVEPIVGMSSEVGKRWNKPIHLLFIDGSHRYEDVVADFETFFVHVVPGGIIALHDVVETWPGPLRAWHEVVKPQLTHVGNCTTLAYGRKPRGNRRIMRAAGGTSESHK
jgi:predicted O-methyltransferase YrrM